MPSHGDFEQLPNGGLRTLLRKFGSEDMFGNKVEAKTGRIILKDPKTEKEGSIYLDQGCIYAVTFTGFVPPMASRLYTGGYVGQAQFEELSKVPNEKVGEFAVEKGYFAKEIIDNINRQMILSSLTYLYGWDEATWSWEPNSSYDKFTIPKLETMLLLAAADERLGQWSALSRNFPQVTKANASITQGQNWEQIERIDPSPEMRRIASMVNGGTTIANVANVCGFTRFEIAAKLARAVVDGTLAVTDPDAKETKPVSITPEDKHELEEAIREVQARKQALIIAEKNLEAIQFRLGQAF